RRLGRVGGLAVSAAAAAPFVALWGEMVRSADDPLTVQGRLDMAIWMGGVGGGGAVGPGRSGRAAGGRVGDPARRPARLGSGHDGRAGPGPGPRGAVAVRGRLRPRGGLPTRRQPGGGGGGRCPDVRGPGGDRAGHRRRPARGTGVRAELRRAGGWAGDPGGGPFGPGRPGRARPGGRRAGAGRRRRLCRGHHLVRGRGPPAATRAPRPPPPPGGGVVRAVVLAGCLWLALRPPRWLLPDRHARRFGVGMALALVAGFALSSRLGLRGGEADAGVMSFLLFAAPLVVLAGSAAAAAVGRPSAPGCGPASGPRCWAGC